MRHALRAASAIALLMAATMAGGATRNPDAAHAACHGGAYALVGGEILDVNATSTPGTLRWHRVDGRTGTVMRGPDGAWRGRAGWTDRSDPTSVRFGGCDDGQVVFDGQAGRKVPLEVTDTRFQGANVTLRGRLVMPPGKAPVPIVVLVHGSEAYSGVDYYHAQHLFPAHGIGVFVYDKRGTGQSGGKYTQAFDVLATDAVAALGEARRLAGTRVSRIGFQGSSQGGWVAPLAATRTSVDYVLVAYGLAEAPAAEDREQVMQELLAAGHGPDVLSKAREVTDATGRLMATRSRAAAARLREVQRKYRGEPWWPVMQGEFTGSLLRYPPWVSRLMLPFFDRGTPWDHEPVPVLRSVSAPQLWMIAAEDREAPPTETLRRLAQLAHEGHPITTVVFPETDHGLVEFETRDDGVRTRTRYADGYLRMSMDFIRDGRIDEAGYGRVRVASAPAVL